MDGSVKLTPVDPHILPIALATIAARLELDSAPALALNRIAATAKNPIVCSEVSAHRRGALELVRLAGLPAINEAPSSAFSWDGAAVRTDSEASVLIHEVAHWLIAPPARRALPDFGLGAGPETGCAALADAACCVDNATKEEEELLASLLGILFEAALGQPAISAFIEQNWLEWRTRLRNHPA